MHNKTPRDGREIARDNEEEVLHALAQFGWLVTRQINAFAWSDSANPGAAHRTLKRLRERGEVTWGRGPDGSTVYALTLKGARRFEDIYGADAGPTKDLLRYIDRTFEHRSLANDVCIWWKNLGTGENRFFDSEHDVAAKRGIVTKKDPHFCSKTGKIPDSMLYCDAPRGTELHGCRQAKLATWVEVEFAHKNKDKQLHLVEELSYILGQTGTQMSKAATSQDIMTRFVVHEALVVCPTDTLETRLVNTLAGYLTSSAARDISKEYVLNHLKIWRPEPAAGQPKVETVAQLIWRREGWKDHARKTGLMWRAPTT